MAGHVLSVCVFCLICATHSPCASHAALTPESARLENAGGSNSPLFKSVARERFKEKNLWEVGDIRSDTNKNRHIINKRDNNDTFVTNSTATSNISNKDFYLKKLFSKYGNGETLSLEGFQALMNDVLQLQQNSHDLEDATENPSSVEDRTASNYTCPINNNEINSLKIVDNKTLDTVCPAILYSLLSGSCSDYVSVDNIIEKKSSDLAIWLYSTGAVILISACGVLSLIIIPVMQKKFYKPLLQFLVALAVGTLAGDALLHLLPHAMSTSSHHGHGHHEDNHENMWKGFVAMLGLILFFIMERFIPLMYRCKKSKRGKGHSHVKVLHSEMEISKPSATQCVDKYNAYDRCYKDILDDPSTTFLKTDNKTEAKKEKPNNQKANNLSREKNSAMFRFSDKDQENENQIKITGLIESNQNSTECPSGFSKPNCTEINMMLPAPVMGELDLLNKPADDSYTVILSEHGAAHHGHSHVHGHVHAAPQNLSSVAWMVIMGDGLHNFTDGMAIGAAFAGSLAGGFSTAVAVFCHELPHELGDFAMLLKAGMSIKQALFYNIISSILCILGNMLGVWLGNTESASSWVFAVAAGTFIYIALVDMIPELSSAHDDEGDFVQSILHLSGLLMGFGIMTLIALYEHDLKNIFKE